MDLPTFCRPTTASFRTGSDGRAWVSGSRLVSRSSRSVRPFALSALTKTGAPKPQRVELRRGRLVFRVLDLVRHEQHRPPQLAQARADLLVERHQSLLRVHQEEHHVGALEGAVDLRLDLGGQVVRRADAAGVPELEQALVVLDDGADPVARDAGGRVHDGDALPRQAVQERRLADVRPPDDDDRRDRAGAAGDGAEAGGKSDIAARQGTLGNKSEVRAIDD